MVAEYNVGEEVLRKALAEREDRRRELEVEKENLDKEIRGLKSDLDHLVSLHSDNEAQEPPQPMESPNPAVASRDDSDFWDVRHAEGSLSQEITDAILQILLEERPMHTMHRKKILEKVEAKGILLGGTDRIRTLSSYLSNDRRFVTDGQKGRGTWTLAGEPPESLIAAQSSQEGAESR